MYDGQVTVWSEGSASPTVEIVPKEDHSVVEALQLARVWLHQLGAKDAAEAMDAAVSSLENHDGYLKSRAMVLRVFLAGLRSKEAERKPRSPALPPWSGPEPLAVCWDAGGIAGYLNRRARRRLAFPGWGRGPLDTDTVRSAFARANKVIDGMKELAAG